MMDTAQPHSGIELQVGANSLLPKVIPEGVTDVVQLLEQNQTLKHEWTCMRSILEAHGLLLGI